jgi:hypothetical protein
MKCSTETSGDGLLSSSVVKGNSSKIGGCTSLVNVQYTVYNPGTLYTAYNVPYTVSNILT